MTVQPVAGTELDRLVAERVMGWTKVDERYDSGKDLRAVGDVDGWHIRRHFRPSIEIAHAWEVVEALRARGIELGLLPGDPGWICGFSVAGSPLAWHESLLYRDEPDVCGKWARAGTAPLAICRAALLTLEQGAER